MVISLAAYVASDNKIAYIILKHKAQSSINDIKDGIKIYEKKGGDTYQLDPEVLNHNLERGNGLNLLLMGNLSTGSYVKELLELYQQSAEGKISSFNSGEGPYYFMPLEGLLAKHYNEVGSYGSTPVLKSALPYDSGTKTIHWNKARGVFPAEAFTLRNANGKIIGSSLDGGISLSSTGIYRSDTIFWGPFQISKNYYTGGAYKSKLNGYQSDANRNSEIFYLPDNLEYVQQWYSKLFSDYGDLGDFQYPSNIMVATSGVMHNGGYGHLGYFLGYGTNGYDKLKTYISEGYSPPDLNVRSEVARSSIDQLVQYARAIDRSVARGVSLTEIGKGYGASFWYLFEEGYSLWPGHTEKITPAQMAYVVQAYNLLYKESKSIEQVKVLMKEKEVYPWEKHSDYLTRNDFNRVYGDISNSNALNKYVMYKLEERTSDNYRGTINGNSPRVLHRTHSEAMGQFFDLYGKGPWIYARMLEYAGVGVDPTDPSTYYSEFVGEYIPEVMEFRGIMEKIGADLSNPGVAAMIERGYEISGFWYYLGGQALPVNAKNWNAHNAFRYSSSGTSSVRGGVLSNRTLTRLAYATKDGTNPEDSAHNRRDENLIHYGKLLLDCSTLISNAFNNTVGKITGTVMPSFSNSLYSSGNLKTIPKSSAKTGDIFVKHGHVFFYLSTNNTSASQTLTVSETKTEKDHRVTRGRIWVLEAADYETRVGIRSRAADPGDSYILRRIKDLDR